MSQFPTLETERFILRQIKQDDSQEIFQYFSMDEVTKFYDLESFTNIEQAEELIRRWNQRFENNQGIRWGITLRSEDCVIGTCGFHGWAKNHCKIEIGYGETQRAFTLKMFSLYYSYFPLHRKNRVASTTDTIAMPIKTAASKPYSVMGASVHVPRSN